jgi:hypothetical protein
MKETRANQVLKNEQLVEHVARHWFIYSQCIATHAVSSSSSVASITSQHDHQQFVRLFMRFEPARMESRARCTGSEDKDDDKEAEDDEDAAAESNGPREPARALWAIDTKPDLEYKDDDEGDVKGKSGNTGGGASEAVAGTVKEKVVTETGDDSRRSKDALKVGM